MTPGFIIFLVVTGLGAGIINAALDGPIWVSILLGAYLGIFGADIYRMVFGLEPWK